MTASTTRDRGAPNAVIIIGGGIGGLALALALRRVGVRARVFERAPVLEEVGAGLGLWTNALRVLDQLGVGERIRDLGAPLGIAEICNDRGETLSRMELREVISEPGAANYVVHRAELHGALFERLPGELLVTDAECVGVEQDAAGAVAHFRGRPSERAALIVGADGLHSAVRAALWGSGRVRYSGQTCYRGIAPFVPDDPRVLREVQGPGRRAAVCPLGNDRVYWWAALNAPAGEADDPARRREQLLERYAGWAFGVPEAIAATTGPILRNDLVDRAPLKRWSQGRVTLLGDAAHPMLPNLGQGACTAIEDALVLARSVARHGLEPRALQAYEGERIGRTTSVVRQSWSFGIPARWEHPWAVRLREQLVRRTPAAVLKRTLRQHLAYDAGMLPRAVGT